MRSPATSPAPARPRVWKVSVPPAACETAEGDQADHGDDQPQQEAPEDRHNDPDDHEDAAERYPADSTTTTTTSRCSHAFSLRVGGPPRHSAEPGACGRCFVAAQYLALTAPGRAAGGVGGVLSCWAPGSAQAPGHRSLMADLRGRRRETVARFTLTQEASSGCGSSTKTSKPRAGW